MATERMEFQPGQVVRDIRYGQGKVISVNENAVTVRFAGMYGVVQVAQSRLILEDLQDPKVIMRPLASHPRPASGSIPINRPVLLIQKQKLSTIRVAGNNHKAQATSEFEHLDATQAAIKEFCESRRIKALFHFTQWKNVASIVDKGLLSRNALSNAGVNAQINDVQRWDGHPDAISLSISWPNYKMFFLLRKNYPGTRWAVLEIDPAALWLCDCAFYPENAARRTAASHDASSLKQLSALKALFVEATGGHHRHQCLSSEFPTNPQAEVLSFGEVRPSLIRTVGVETVVESFEKMPSKTEHRPNWFTPRCDYELWRKSAT